MAGPRDEVTRPIAFLAPMVLLLAACGSSDEPTEEGATRIAILEGDAHAAEGAISIETGDWTYAVPLDGVTWVSADGVWNDSGRPDCLSPRNGTVRVRFAAAEVTIDGTTWRPVIWVDCR